MENIGGKVGKHQFTQIPQVVANFVLGVQLCSSLFAIDGCSGDAWVHVMPCVVPIFCCTNVEIKGKMFIHASLTTKKQHPKLLKYLGKKM